MIRVLALVLTVVTGFSGLVYEVAWQRYLATLLGSHGEATAAVLAIFLGGLALGYSLFGRLTRALVTRAEAAGRSPRLLIWYGGVEASIGLYAFAFPLLFGAARALSVSLPIGAGPLSFLCDVALSALLIGPPSVLMGGTIPILTQALSRGLEDATRLHALVYAFNTAGAFVGALAAGFWLVPTLGLVGVLATVGWVNVLAGACFLVLGWRPRSVETPAADDSARQVAGFGSYAFAALSIGFAMMTIQVVFIRLGGLSLGSTQFTFAMVVAVFVLCIALGSMAVSAMPRIASGVIVANQWLLVGLLLLLYPFLEDGPYWAHALRTLFRDQTVGFYPFYVNVFAALLLITGPPVMLSGAALPLLFHHLRREVGDLGGVAGRLYSWNTVGSLLGALVGGYLLFSWLNLDGIYLVAVGALAIAAVVLSLRVLPSPRGAWVSALIAPALIAMVWLPAWSPLQLASGTFRYRLPNDRSYAGPETFFDSYADIDVRFYDDDPAVSVAVIEHPVGDLRSTAIVTNGKPDGSIEIDYVTMALAAILPAILAENAERAFVIGYGTGVTVGELAALDTVDEVVVAEISSGVIEAAPYFDEFNLNASTHPKVRIVRGDAYRALQRSEGTYDLISSEPSNPWVTGVEMLFSREFLEAAKARLEPGGVYMQWFHSYETDDETVELVVRTFASVFEGVAIWYATGQDYLILGFPEGSGRTDLERVLARAVRPDIAAGLARSGIGGAPELLAHELLPVGVIETLDRNESIHTLLHPILSDRAARAFFRGGEGSLPRTAHIDAAQVGARSSLVRQLAARHGGKLPPEFLAPFASETCRWRTSECAVVLARWLYDEPESGTARQLLGESRRRAAFRNSPGSRSFGSIHNLFGVKLSGESRVSPAAARSATENFVRFYHHAVPFARSSLRELWDACEREPDQADVCREGRSAAERLVGDLGLELPVLAGEMARSE